MPDKPLIVREERIREIEFGILDVLTSEGIKAKYREEYARREREGKYWYRPPGGESRPDVALRVQSSGGPGNMAIGGSESCSSKDPG